MEPVYGGHLDIHAYLNDGRRIRLGDLGEGVQSFAMSRMLYELINPQTILWDDIESHLNPRILGYIAEWFNELVKNGKQIVLSTHSLEAANVIAGVNEEETRIYLTSLQESTLKTKKLTLSELEDFQRAGIDVRTAEAFLL
jgi:predicted ATPase